MAESVAPEGKSAAIAYLKMAMKYTEEVRCQTCKHSRPSGVSGFRLCGLNNALTFSVNDGGHCQHHEPAGLMAGSKKESEVVDGQG